MNIEPDSLEARLRRVFRKVIRRQCNEPIVRASELEEWDSLSHINLVIELESEFDIDIDPESIAALYSDSSVILAFLREHALAAKE